MLSVMCYRMLKVNFVDYVEHPHAHAGCKMYMEGTPAHLPFTFVRFGGHAGKSPGHAGKTIFCGRYLITLKSKIRHVE